MTSITNNPYGKKPAIDHFPEMVSGTFCNKNDKFIRVAADSTSRLCLALFYLIISYSYRIVGSPTAHHYKSLASYQSIKALKIFTYLQFGKEIIDFSMNSSHKIKNPLPSTITEEQALRSIYEDLDVDQWMNIGTKNIVLDKNRLCRLEINNGCCLGMSFDFISRYLRENKSITFASSYIEGASDKAQLAQIFYRALDSDLDTQEKKEALENSFQEKMNKLTNDLKTEYQRIQALAEVSDELLESLVQLKNNISAQIKEFGEELPIVSAKLGLEKNQLIANFFKLTIDMDKVAFFKKAKKEQKMAFEAFTNDLPNGVYHVGIVPKSKIGHATVYIKREGKHLIFDPNLAILAVDPKYSAERLWTIARMYLNKEDSCISFSPFS